MRAAKMGPSREASPVDINHHGHLLGTPGLQNRRGCCDSEVEARELVVATLILPWEGSTKRLHGLLFLRAGIGVFGTCLLLWRQLIYQSGLSKPCRNARKWDASELYDMLISSSAD